MMTDEDHRCGQAWRRRTLDMTAGSLTRWLAWLRMPDCSCPYERHPTRWIRLASSTDCRWHGAPSGAEDRFSRRA